jgi:hypothetical protein
MNQQHNNAEKVAKAIDYLRERNIYLIDSNNKFVPTCAAGTDVKATWQRYLSQCMKINGKTIK